ncbi:GntR family transcriptional regulator [bacterium]|nr:GntR family transcriptional regulator [bacterium]
MAELELKIDPNSEVPIYVQVKNQLRLAVEKGVLKSGTQLPTVRNLALELGINANTVTRIYADLEREGYLARRHGIGTFAADPRGNEDREVPGRAQLIETVRQLKSLGYTDRQIIEMTAEALGEVE